MTLLRAVDGADEKAMVPCGAAHGESERLGSKLHSYYQPLLMLRMGACRLRRKKRQREKFNSTIASSLLCPLASKQPQEGALAEQMIYHQLYECWPLA